MSGIQRWIKDPFPSLSHVLGVGLSVVALTVLLNHTHGSWRLAIGFTVYGLSLIALYCASALTHGVRCSPRTSDQLDKLDYGAIYLLIAGTYTPLCLVTLRGPWGWGMLTVEWLLAGVGIFDVAFGNARSNLLRVILYSTMGWLVMFAIGPLLSALPRAGILLLLGGGVIYSAGAVIFVTNRPHLWRGVFNAHDLWHVMVLAGSACHFFLILNFVSTVAVR